MSGILAAVFSKLEKSKNSTIKQQIRIPTLVLKTLVQKTYLLSPKLNPKSKILEISSKSSR